MGGGMDGGMGGGGCGSGGYGGGDGGYGGDGKGKGKSKEFRERAGDWICPSCGNVCFATRVECNRCQAPRPMNVERKGMKPGDWICGNCGDLVFSWKNSCKMCGTLKCDSEQPPAITNGSTPY